VTILTSTVTNIIKRPNHSHLSNHTQVKFTDQLTHFPYNIQLLLRTGAGITKPPAQRKQCPSLSSQMLDEARPLVCVIALSFLQWFHTVAWVASGSKKTRATYPQWFLPGKVEEEKRAELLSC